MVPTLPALAAIRALGDGSLSQPGARACVGVLDLDQISREFAPYRIATHLSTSARHRSRRRFSNCSELISRLCPSRCVACTASPPTR